MSGFPTRYSTILQLVWTLDSPMRALTGKGGVVVSGDVAYNLLVLDDGLTGAHCTACLICPFLVLEFGACSFYCFINSMHVPGLNRFGPGHLVGTRNSNCPQLHGLFT